MFSDIPIHDGAENPPNPPCDRASDLYLSSLLQLQPQQLGFGARSGAGIVPFVLVECVTAFVQGVYCRLAFLFLVVVLLKAIWAYYDQFFAGWEDVINLPTLDSTLGKKRMSVGTQSLDTSQTHCSRMARRISL